VKHIRNRRSRLSKATPSVKTRSNRRRSETDSELRSRIMRSVRQKGTAPELAVGRFLYANGVRYRKNVRTIPGSPDFCNQTRRFAIFVHGCFWHRHPGCRLSTTPKQNAKFWKTKFVDNVRRDRQKERELAGRGFDVRIVWQCEAREPTAMRRTLRGIVR
jgi:DNA mismatch endonuclease (patch repair protein)